MAFQGGFILPCGSCGTNATSMVQGGCCRRPSLPCGDMAGRMVNGFLVGWNWSMIEYHIYIYIFIYTFVLFIRGKLMQIDFLLLPKLRFSFEMSKDVNVRANAPVAYHEMLVCLDVFGQTELEALIFRRNYATMGTPVHAWKLTCNLNISSWKRRTIHKPPIFGFHASFPGVVLLMKVTYCAQLIDWFNFYTIRAEAGAKIKCNQIRFSDYNRKCMGIDWCILVLVLVLLICVK